MASLGPKDKEVGLDNSDEDEDDMYVEDTEPSKNEKFDRSH